jgi:hypothetical protein
MNALAPIGTLAFIYVIVRIAVIGYALFLGYRLVNAVEKIADSFLSR